MPNSEGAGSSNSSSSSDGDAGLTSGGGGGGETAAAREAAFRARFPAGRVEAKARVLRGGAAVEGVAAVWRTPDDAVPVRVALTLRPVGAGDAILARSLDQARALAAARAIAAALGGTRAASVSSSSLRVREPAPHDAPIVVAALPRRHPGAAAAAAPRDASATHAAAQLAALLDAARRAGLPSARVAALRDRLADGTVPPAALRRLAIHLRRWLVTSHDRWLGGRPDDGGHL